MAHRLRSALFTNPLPALEVLESGLEILRGSDLRAMLPLIQQPTLIMHGEHDAVTPCAAGEALSVALPDAEFHKITGAGHAPFLSHSSAMITLLQAFLNDQPATA